MKAQRLRGWTHEFEPGMRVAHASLDQTTGPARSGVVTEVVGEGVAALVVVRWDDNQETEGYDERELVPLLGITRFGPAFLSVGQVGRWIKHFFVRSARQPKE